MDEQVFYIKNIVVTHGNHAKTKDSVLDGRTSVDREDEGLTPVDIELGKAVIKGPVGEQQRSRIARSLHQLGFELLDDRSLQIIEQIKAAVIRLVHYKGNSTAVNLSNYVQQELHQDYSALSKLFSEYTSMTLERYYIEQRVERVKELLTYNELNITEIALSMNYSSVAYLSAQFKSVTGMTPSQFRQISGNKRRELDRI